MVKNIKWEVLLFRGKESFTQIADTVKLFRKLLAQCQCTLVENSILVFPLGIPAKSSLNSFSTVKNSDGKVDSIICN